MRRAPTRTTALRMTKASKELIRQIDAFLKRTGMSPTAFGEKAMNERGFVKRLRGGSDLRTATMEKIQDFMIRCEKHPKQRRGMYQRAA